MCVSLLETTVISEDNELLAFIDELLKNLIDLIPQAEAGTVLIKTGNFFSFKAAIGFDITALKNIVLVS